MKESHSKDAYTKDVFFSEVYRGEVYFADLDPVIGSEQGGNRPVLIIQNDIGNRFSPTVIVAAITTKISKTRIPTHVELRGKENGMEKDSVILLEQIRTIDKKRLTAKITSLTQEVMLRIDEAILISLGLGKFNFEVQVSN